MRPPRLILLLLCFIFLPILLTFLSLLSAHPRNVNPASSSVDNRSGRLRSFFSFHAPSSLFPPSAVISLTDDNSTFFLARPAAFGPLLPDTGLSGQLWIGSGFGDDTPRKGGATTGAEGELGCSDVPGWDEGENKHVNPDQGTTKTPQGESIVANPPTIPGKDDTMALNRRRSVDPDSEKAETPSNADGTDDHLHHPLPESYFPDASKSQSAGDLGRPVDKSKAPAHADIQSLQEGAEIAGKVVLLSRGGCGFLEKVKWVQRRGGTALIVGDDTRGGGLVTMYARGDTSNITIPALFTSHTTAHLLSSLIPAGSFVENLNLEDPKNNHGESNLKNTLPKGKSTDDGHGTTLTKTGSKPASSPRSTIVPAKLNGRSSDTSEKSKIGWLRSLFSPIGLDSDDKSREVPEDSRRPPSSGHIDWVLLDDWEEEGTASKTSNPYYEDNSRHHDDSKSLDQSKKPASHQSGGDGFVIGVQDWRDPDLITGPASAAPKPSGILEKLTSKPQEKEASDSSGKSSDSSVNSPKGGSITPGSGEYVSPDKSQDGKASNKDSSHAFNAPANAKTGSSSHEGGWWSAHFSWSGSKGSDGPGSGVPMKEENSAPKDGKSSKTSSPGNKAAVDNGDEEEEHEGLWVTLTPTNMSTSPFFDTLLVLVVSPLVTLTVVYALLLLRSRIRRRRWRAPKSVVDRLPVRTYQTMSSSPPSPTRAESVAPESSSPTSPLLPSNSRPISTRPRPRSQTFSGLFATSFNAGESRPSNAEKTMSTSQPARRRYTGRQVECVVCLEEYVEGQSRVMSLPCGHEFHAECM